MFVKLKNFTAEHCNIFNNKKCISAVLVLGLCGIAILTFSDKLKFTNKNNASSAEDTTLVQYVASLEKKTREIISKIDGAGKCEIMITANASAKKDFATDESIKRDSQNRSEGLNIINDVEKEIVMVEDENGNKTALVKNVFEPEIRGVVVLCQGADDKTVVENITCAAKTLLGVSANKISVLKMK